jgi:Fur family ferric uptake transcriptional regulator
LEDPVAEARSRRPRTHPPLGTGRAGGAAEPGPEERLVAYLRARHLRMTPERRWVLEEVLSREGHFDAEDLLRFLHRRHRAVSRATLYRTLDHLAVAGLVKRHRFGPGHALFERNFDRQHHDHLVCDRCGSILEFVNDEIERLQDEVCSAHAFRPTNHVMQIFGICKRCQARERTDA